MKNALIISLGLLIAAPLAVLAWRDRQTTRDTESAVGRIETERTAMRATRTALEQRLAAAEQKRAALQAQQARTAAARKSPSAAPQAISTVADRLGADPKLQALYFAGLRNQIAVNFGPFFRRAALGPDQVARMQEVLLKKSEQEMDLQMTARTQGVTMNAPEIRALNEKFDAETQTAEREALGDAAYAQFKDYERSAAVRDVVQGLVGMAVLEGAPLTASQAEQLGQVLANASPSYRQGGRVKYEEIDWSAAEGELKSVLSDAQLDLFHNLEPLGGGASRFGSTLTTVFAQAVRAEHQPADAGGR